MFMKPNKHLKRSITKQSDSMANYKKLTVATMVSIALSGCGSEIEQANSNQINSWSRAPIAEAAGENCEFGGQKIETGADENRDGELQDSEINQVEYLCDIKTTDTYVNDMSNLDDNFWRTFSLYPEDNTTAGTDDAIYRFQGDLLRIKRGENTAEYLDYVIPGAAKSAVVTAYYWEGDTPEVSPFKIFASKVGANNANDWVELTVNLEKVGDYTQRDADEDQGDEENDNWAKFEFTASDILNEAGEGYDFIRVQFPVVVSGQAWHPQLGNLTVDYNADDSLVADNNQAPAPASDPNAVIIPVVQSDSIDNWNNIFSTSGGLVFDSSDVDEGNPTRFHNDTSRLKSVGNTGEYVQYEVHGAVQSVEVVAHYWAFEDTEAFRIMVSKTGGDDAAEWVELGTTHTPDPDDAVDDWSRQVYTAVLSEDQISEDYDFVRVVFPILARDYSPGWALQLGDVNISYVEDYSLDSDNVARDLSNVEIAGGQAPMAVEQALKDIMATNGITSVLDWYVTRGEGSNGIGDSNKLYTDDSAKEFRFISYNVPNLVMSEDPVWDIKPTFEQEDGIKTIADMGGKVARIYTMGIFESSNPDKIKQISWDDSGNLVYNEDIFVAMDNLLAIANKHGVRIQIPFIDRNGWWGGIAHFAEHYGKTSPEFFTDDATIAGFKEMISYVLNRVNTVTGVTYKDDPAVFAWETGNELRSDDLAAIEAWTADIASHIKSIDSKHLVMDGREARSTKAAGEETLRMSNAAMFNPNIDVVSNHYYMSGPSAFIDQDLATVGGTKPFVVGEIGFGDLDVAAAIDTIISEGATGLLVWSLRTHDIQGGFKDHADGNVHAYHWPGFDDNYAYNETNIVSNLWEMAYAIDGETRPDIPAPAKAPVMLASGSNLDIRWQGVTSAQYYDIERSDNGTDGWVLVGDDIEIGGTNTDNYILADRTDSFGNIHTNVKHQILFQDGSAAANEDNFYRVKAINDSGESAWSNVINTTGMLIENGIVNDKLGSLSTATEISDASTLFVDTGNTEFFEDDDSGRIKHSGVEEEWLMYSFAGDVNSFWVKTYFWRGAPQTDVVDFKIQLSTDGTNWDDFESESTIVAQRGDWEQIDLVGRGITGGYKHIRVVFPVSAEDYSSWAQQLGNVLVGVGSGVPELPAQQTDDGLIIEDFESYSSTASLKSSYKDLAWGNPSLDETGDSKQLKISYDIDALGYAGVGRDYASAQDWTSGNAIKFSFSHENAGNIIVIQVEEKEVQLRGDGKPDTWEKATVMDASNQDGDFIIKFSDFGYPHWFGDVEKNDGTVFDANDIYKLNIYINKEYPGLSPANTQTGESLLIDDISIVTVP